MEAGNGQQQPVFGAMMIRLKNMEERMSELSTLINNRVGVICNFPDVPPKSTADSPTPSDDQSTFVGMFNQHMDALENHARLLSKSAEKLAKLVGT